MVKAQCDVRAFGRVLCVLCLSHRPIHALCCLLLRVSREHHPMSKEGSAGNRDYLEAERRRQKHRAVKQLAFATVSRNFWLGNQP